MDLFVFSCYFYFVHTVTRKHINIKENKVLKKIYIKKTVLQIW